MMDLSLDMIVEQQQRVSPTLIAVNQILALSSQELQVAIKQEAEENPAFEVTERQTCNMCGEVLKNGVCTNCLRGQTGPTRASQGDEFTSSAPDNDFAGGYNFSSAFGDG